MMTDELDEEVFGGDRVEVTADMWSGTTEVDDGASFDIDNIDTVISNGSQIGADQVQLSFDVQSENWQRCNRFKCDGLNVDTCIQDKHEANLKVGRHRVIKPGEELHRVASVRVCAVIHGLLFIRNLLNKERLYHEHHIACRQKHRRYDRKPNFRCETSA
uniref:Uncharacterized protein n=1 Tax=Cacopsylla melanoneura TaxID=428564 RepID=A0A8D9DNU0_9HEMI